MLGKQAEVCFEYIIKHSKRYQLLAANIQIQGKTKTLGELDYLIFDTETNKTLHIELACKFYLFDDNLGPEDAAKWIGPNRKDTLEEKLEKVKEKQFPLLYTSETATLLNDLKLNSTTIEQQLCIKSFLFIPKHFRKEQLPTYYQDCLMGTYISFSEFNPEDDEAQYALPDKKQWLLPPENIKNWYFFTDAKESITKLLCNKKSPLVYKKQKGKIEKFFVVWW